MATLSITKNFVILGFGDAIESFTNNRPVCTPVFANR